MGVLQAIYSLDDISVSKSEVVCFNFSSSGKSTKCHNVQAKFSAM